MSTTTSAPTTGRIDPSRSIVHAFSDGDTIHLAWTPDPLALFFETELRDQTGAIAATSIHPPTGESCIFSKHLHGLRPGETYWARLRPVYADGGRWGIPGPVHVLDGSRAAADPASAALGAAATLPAPLLQAFFQTPSVELRWSQVVAATAYEAQLLDHTGSVVASGSFAGTVFSASFNSTEYNLQQGAVYSARVRGSNATQSGQWSIAQPVTVQDIPTPTPAITFEGGTLYATVTELVAGATLYSFQLQEGNGDTIDEAVGTAADLPLPFTAQATDGATYQVIAEGWTGNTLSAWSAPVPITVVVLPPPPLTLSTTALTVDAAWIAVDGITQYQFELWTTVDPAQLVNNTTLTAPPYQVTVVDGIVEDTTYLGKVRSQQGQNSSVWNQQTITASVLDPLLVALEARLNAAWQASSETEMPIDATTLGEPGAAIITLFQENLGLDAITLTGFVEMSSDALADTLTVTGTSVQPLLGMEELDISFVFAVYDNALVVTLMMPVPMTWSFPLSYPSLAGTNFADLTFVTDITGTPAFVLSSLPQPAGDNRGPLLSGLNFFGYLMLEGSAAALLSLIPDAANPILVTGTIATTEGTTTITLLGALPSITFDQFVGLESLAFNDPAFTLRAAFDPMRIAVNTGFGVDANVMVGSLVLPLSVQLPIGMVGWVIALRPGRTIPVPTLTSLFSFVTGTEVIDALPEDVAEMSTFQIDSFRLSLGKDFVTFGALSFSISSIPAESGESLWPVLPGIFEVNALQLQILVAHNQAGELSTTGWINGWFLLGETFQLQSSIVLPVGAGNWTFTISTQTQMTNLDAFDEALGGSTMSSILPAGLGDLPRFILRGLTFVINPALPSLVSMSLTMESASLWRIVGDSVVLKSLYIDLFMSDPTSATRTLTGIVSGELVIGSVSIKAWVNKPSPTEDWILSVSTSPVDLPSLGDLTNLAGGSVAALLPTSLQENHFILDDTSLVVNLSTQTLLVLAFTLYSPDAWPVIPNNVLTIVYPTVYLTLDWSSGTRVVTGGMGGIFVVGGASFAVEATYENEIWTLTADMVPPSVEEGDMDYSEALTQFGGYWVIPSGVGLPEMILTSASARLVPSTGEFYMAATSTLIWPVPFGTGTKPIQITGLGGSIHLFPNDTGYAATITGTIAYDQLQASILVMLGSEGIDTVITATISVITPSGIPQLADDLAADASGSNAWGTIPFPPGFPDLGLASATLTLNLTKNIFILYGGSGEFGMAAFVIQKVGEGWQYAFGINLSLNGSSWRFTELSPGLAPADTFFSLDAVTAAASISSMDTQSLEAIVRQVPQLAYAIPTTVKKGVSFYATLYFNGAVVGNVPKILNGVDSPGTIVTLYALLADPSAGSLFQASLDHYTLAGVVTFSDVFLQWKPSSSPGLWLHGTIAVTVDSTNYVFIGDMQVTETDATFSVRTAQAINEPFGMTGIVLNQLLAEVDYQFPAGSPTTLAITLEGDVTIGQVVNLTGLLYLLNGIPILTSIEVTTFSITNLFEQSISAEWPSDKLVPLEFIWGAIYYYQPVDPNDQSPLTFNGHIYLPGFNVSTQIKILGAPATITISVNPALGITASGRFDAPLNWGFVIVSGETSLIGPSASIATYPQTTYTLAAGFTLFDYYMGRVLFVIWKNQSTNEDEGTITVTANLPVFGECTITVHWSESGGIWFEDFPVDVLAKFEIPNLDSEEGGCIGKEFLQSLPIDTQYNFDTSYSMGDGPSLDITVQGYFELTAMNEQILRIDLQRIVISVPSPVTGEAPFSWSDIPLWITNTIIDNAYSIFKQVLNDPASMAKLLAIEGVKFIASSLVDALICENEELWAEAAEGFVEGALSAFATEVIVDGLPFIVGGIGLVIGAGGLVTIGGSSGGGGGGGGTKPSKPGTPSNLTMNYTSDTLFLGWSSVTNGNSYAYKLTDSTNRTIATQSNLGGTSATVPGSSLIWGATYQLTVVANHDGVLGDTSSPKSYQIPTPEGTAQALHAAGDASDTAARTIRDIFPSLDANRMASSISSAWGYTDPATSATPLAIALRNGGYNELQTGEALKHQFPSITPTELAAALTAAYSLSAGELAEYLESEGYSYTNTAAIIASVIIPKPTPSELISALEGAYGALSAEQDMLALAAGSYTPSVAGRGVLAAHPTTTATSMAEYMVEAYIAPPITAPETAIALVATYTSPSITPTEVAQALRAAFNAPEPITPGSVAQALVAAFTTPAITSAGVLAALVGAYPTLGANDLAPALVLAFTSPAITSSQVATDLVTVFTSPAITPSENAIALVAAFISPAVTPTEAAQALRAAYLTPTPITATEVGTALVAAFTTPTPITPTGVAVALAGAFTPAELTVTGAAQALAAIFLAPPITAGEVTVALVAAYPTATDSDVAVALVATFTTPAITASGVATALVQGFVAPAITPERTVTALIAAFTTPALTPSDAAIALVAAFTLPTAITAESVLTTLIATFPLATPGDLATALVAAFVTPPITAARVATLLHITSFPVPLTSAEIATALVAAFVAPTPITPAEVIEALKVAYTESPLTPNDLATALVAAFVSPAITPTEVAQALQQELVDPAVTASQVAVALVTAFITPAITATQVTDALVATFTTPTAITPSELASALVAAFVTPTPITSDEVAAQLFRIFVSPPITAAEMTAALVAAFINPPITFAQAATTLVTIYTAPAITPTEVAQALLAAFTATPPTPTATVQALVAAFTLPTPITANQLAIALVGAYLLPTPITPTEVVNALIGGMAAPPTASAAAEALVAAFVSPTPITPTEVVQALVAAAFTLPMTITDAAIALVAAFVSPTPITPTEVGVALAAGFGELLTPARLTTSLVAAFVTPPITPTEAATALVAVFASVAITPSQTAQALVAAFVTPPITPTEVLTALVAVYLEPALTLDQGAIALMAAFGGATPITPSAMAQALVAVYVAPPATPTEVVAALIAAIVSPPLSPSDAATALVAAYTLPTPITPTEVAQALRAAFTARALEPAEVAAALVIAFVAPALTPAEVMTALQATWVDPALTPEQGAIALRAAFTLPTVITPSQVAITLLAAFESIAITAAQIVAALRGAYVEPALTPAEAAVALVAAFTLPTPITPAETLAALITAYADLPLDATNGAIALVTAFPALTPTDVANQLITAFTTPPVTQDQVAIALVLAFVMPAPITPQQVSRALYDSFLPQGVVTLTSVALALVAAFNAPGPIPAPQVAGALVLTFPAAEATPSAVAQTLVTVYTQPPITPNNLAIALVEAFIAPAVTPGEVAIALRAAYISPAIGANLVAVALVASFVEPSITAQQLIDALREAFNDPAIPLDSVATALHISMPSLSIDDVAQSLVVATPGVTPAQIVQALSVAFTLTVVDSTVLITALVAGFAGTSTTIDAIASTYALKVGLGEPSTMAMTVTYAVAAYFLLTRCPNDVNAMSLALFNAGYTLNAASYALGQLYAPAWSTQGFEILLDVYSDDVWNLVLQLRAQGDTVVEAAVAIKQQYQTLDNNTMVLVLTAAYDYTRVESGTTPIAESMKAAIYTLNEAAEAMGAYYKPDWSGEDFAQLLAVYSAD